MLLASFAAADLVVAAWLLWSVPRSPRNREAVITVAAMLLGFAGLLSVLALT